MAYWCGPTSHTLGRTILSKDLGIPDHPTEADVLDLLGQMYSIVYEVLNPNGYYDSDEREYTPWQTFNHGLFWRDSVQRAGSTTYLVTRHLRDLPF